MKYFYPKLDIKYSKKSYAKSQISEILKRVVKNQLVGDVPVGLFLSGGIDSSLLLALMSESNNKPVNTFSSYFELNSKEDDIKFNSDFYLARITSKHFGSRCVG